jgi:hypothetical protein
LRRPPSEGSGGKYIDRRSAFCWIAALLSAFGLPWSGIPVSYFFGAGSWTWFLFAGVSLGFLKDDGKEFCRFRRGFAAFNLVAIVAAMYVFMYATGVPGDIPGIEGLAAVNSLGGLSGDFLMSSRILFFISAIASFVPVHSPAERVSALLSFSYSSFLAIVFLPPARVFWPALLPGDAILFDAAAYALEALLIHAFIMGYLPALLDSRRKYQYAIANAILTAAGICFLYASL